MLALSKANFTVMGKVGVLLWQLWLVVGPHFADTGLLLDCIRGVTTDSGVERLMVESSDCLCEFCQHLWPLEPRSDKLTSLFPSGLSVPGMASPCRHVSETSFKQPSLVPVVPGIIESHFELFAQIVRCLERDGFQLIGQMLTKAKHPSLAEWRWGELDNVCRALNAFVESLTSKFAHQGIWLGTLCIS